jgi:hypothetical protein
MKQTAVEWLAIYLKGITSLNCDEVIAKAKEMEKEQIVTAHLTPLRNEYWYKDKEWLNNESEDYYNETYNK